MSDGHGRTYLHTPEQWAQFLSAFVHEMRTPLASLRMLADLQAEVQEPAGQGKRYSEKMREVALDLQVLIGEAAELAQLLTGKAIVRPEGVGLQQLVDLVEDRVRPRAWERGIVLNDLLDPTLPKQFRTDPGRLHRALDLLLEAAVSHARSEVLLRLEPADGDLRIVVSSDGAPFEEATLGTFFEPFSKGVPGRQRGGRSLALPLASEQIRALAGTLRAENRDGRPAFELRVPATGAAGL